VAACGGASNDSRSPPMSKGLLAAGPTVLEVKPKGFAAARCREKKNYVKGITGSLAYRIGSKAERARGRTLSKKKI
jgi:hypothetical protein